MREYDAVVHIGKITDGIKHRVLDDMSWWMKHNTVVMPIMYLDKDEPLMVFGYLRKDTYDKMTDGCYEEMEEAIVKEYSNNKENCSIKYNTGKDSINILVIS